MERKGKMRGQGEETSATLKWSSNGIRALYFLHCHPPWMSYGMCKEGSEAWGIISS